MFADVGAFRNRLFAMTIQYQLLELLLCIINHDHASDWQYFNIASDNVLAPKRRQAITWANTDPSHRGIYAALGGY